MQNISLHANPFALMMNPEAVLAAMERSERLNHLESRVCRPLDRVEFQDQDVRPAARTRPELSMQDDALHS